MENDEKKDQLQTTPDLDVIMKEGLEQFDIFKGEQTSDEPGQDNPPGPAAPKEEPLKETEDDFRFKDHAEAEKGYKNLQGEFTRVSQANKELADKLTVLEKETLQKKAEETAETAYLQFETFATERRTRLLDEIDALDPDDPEYRKKVAAAQGRADREIIEAGQKIALPQKSDPSAPPAPYFPTESKNTPETETTRVAEYVIQKISAPEIGLDRDDPLFWLYAQQAPDKNDKGESIPLDEQIQWAVNKTKHYHSRIKPDDKAQEIANSIKNATENQKREMPLARAGREIPSKETGAQDKPVSLSDALDEANNLRRL